VRHWDDAERVEYDAAMQRIVDEAGKDSTLRGDTAERVISELVAAGKAWARDIERQATRAGLLSEVQRWKRRQDTVPVVRDDVVVKRSSVVGVRRVRPADGRPAWVQEELLSLTKDDVLDRRESSVVAARTYTHDAQEMDRLLELFERVPDADTVGKALAQVGVSLDAWLERAAS
jgi:hypothetical protein